MKKNDTIRCKTAEEALTVLRDLSAAGFHAVAGGDGLTLTITEVPEAGYLMQAWSQEDTQHTYCGTLEEAKEAAQAMLDGGYEYAEICEGYASEWTPVLRYQKTKEEDNEKGTD